MRTEDDLRAAFGSLEGQVTDATRILTGVAHERRRRTLRRRAGGVLAAAGLAVAAAVAIATVPAAPHSQLTAAAVRVKLLAAWTAAGNDILVTHSSEPGGGPNHAVASAVDSWVYPWAASPGQRAQTRNVYSDNGRVDSEFTCSYLVNAKTTANSVSGIFVDYAGRDWSNVTVNGCGSRFNPSTLKSQISSGSWTVSGPADFRGHQALKLISTLTVHVSPGRTAQSTTQLWVDASTYLPLYEYSTTSGVDAGPPVTADFELLPPTPANLALLKPVIPPGFRQILLTSPVGHRS